MMTSKDLYLQQDSRNVLQRELERENRPMFFNKTSAGTEKVVELPLPELFDPTKLEVAADETEWASSMS
uniref:Uncharacterized protein n=1 Tax=Romanomermis culicivorax TaxID=13658 RepID=A0A915JYV4_ROMCU